ncbi:hypothetical protein PP175_05770 [Aneurinibacillus sp. Ricciae_BoGa-3]|nr:hypothetical protein [Aneurinibacillus sp. Ricciae_BoGa-3]WCK55457.1 hypothetical protein PP175_05770 [Aneurinibacillus sp. Ricciae_BoGa-3]
MDKIFDEEQTAKEIKLVYVKQKMLRILKESGLSKEGTIEDFT